MRSGPFPTDKDREEALRLTYGPILHALQDPRGRYGTTFHGDDVAEVIAHELSRARSEARREGVEWCRRLAVRRSCTWSEADDRRSQDYREGIADAASQLATLYAQLLAAPEPGAASPAATTHDTPKGKEV